MSSKTVATTLYIENMICAHCETAIERALTGVKGIESVKASYSSGTVVVNYNPEAIPLRKIAALIEVEDYHVKNQKENNKTKSKTKAPEGLLENKKAKNTKQKEESSDILTLIGVCLILFSVYTIANRLGLLDIFNAFPIAREGMGYGMLFAIGVLTSVHCVSMCGGICLSQCASSKEMTQAETNKWAALRPSFQYNIGRVISYTIIGGLVGALGSVVSFSGTMKGVVQLLAGAFMVIMGLNMLNLFPALRKLNPRMPKIFAQKIYKENDKNNSPLYVGLLNGLMPCGPLQAMQLYALSTGDPLKGAFAMFLFSAGTFPLMFGFGALSSFLNKKYTGKMMKASAVMVLALGLFMFNSGAALSGFGMPLVSSADSVSIQEGKTTASGGVAVIENGVQTVTTEIYPRGYEPIIVQKGVPVKWTIHTEEGDINGCNNSIVIPAYNIQQNLSLGDTVIEFTPEESGTFNFSCWMGMIRSTITVVDDISIVESIIIEQEPDEFDGLYIDGNAASGNAGLPACCS